ncbi:hypothetical protein [Streptomyces sp. MH60]|uniref:hypothetical protein n=1 Tax=Streptomyces sp. MH60 TaxID=1940758 RepID=UPI000CEDABBE|nr:hypothetical protein [Streptomyces sp. MH60]PPS89581.1 hypothetical protein BZZ08_01728 [Streptomyces sp. MH60]
MSAETCGAEHPDTPGTVCDRKPHQNAGYHRERATGTVWAADPLPVVQGTGRGALAAIAARTTRHHHTGPAAEAVTAWRRYDG